VKAHPGTYTSGVASTVWHQLSRSYFRSPPAPVNATATTTPALQVGSGKTLPAPTEDQPIPAGQSVWISRPDNCIRDVWTSATRHHFVFCNGRLRPRFNAVRRQTDRLFAALPDRRGNAQLALRLNQLSRWFPRPIVWIAVGLLGLMLRRPRGSLTLLAVAVSALMIIVLNALGLFADQHFALPVAPAFVLLGAGALLAPRGRGIG